MTKITLHYRMELLRDWKLGRLHLKWYKRDRATFCDRDLSNAENQCKYGWHFGEWFMARHFLRQGYCVLPEKYLSPTRPRALRKATEILGEAGVAFLNRERRFGGSKLRWSPHPDLLVFKSNSKIFFFVEVKRDRDRLSNAQKQFFPMIEEKLGSEVRIAHLKAELTIPFNPRQFSLYRSGDETFDYHLVRWPLKEGRGKWGEFPLVVVREYYRKLGYTVLASEPRLPDGQGFVLLSFSGHRKTRHRTYSQMAKLLGTDLATLDALNRIADKAKIEATGNDRGGDPDLFVYKPDGSERFFVEAKYKDNLSRKQLATFPIIEQKWEVKVVRIVEMV